MRRPQKFFGPLLELLTRDEIVGMSVLVLYEWLRGPRTSLEIHDQETLLPAAAAFPYDAEAAELSAQIYRSVRRARSREIDIAIAACAILHRAPLWTLNEEDFRDIPGLRLYRPKA